MGKYILLACVYPGKNYLGGDCPITGFLWVEGTLALPVCQLQQSFSWIIAIQQHCPTCNIECTVRFVIAAVYFWAGFPVSRTMVGGIPGLLPMMGGHNLQPSLSPTTNEQKQTFVIVLINDTDGHFISIIPTTDFLLYSSFFHLLNHFHLLCYGYHQPFAGFRIRCWVWHDNGPEMKQKTADNCNHCVRMFLACMFTWINYISPLAAKCSGLYDLFFVNHWN